ncbi:hypothetical protein M3196_10130 [Fictibacillus nanhaiensis]|uniref:hypothetical protein n=1 Tax=Fictibacillus nanhaiensis TaxID=742169 RepID=UPI00204014C6|nr:hypothetical protein [Fictibacillus nanhaiensis]MCM3732016.1 hypothetical protein [Fictibacillus nanhaiensis]
MYKIDKNKVYDIGVGGFGFNAEVYGVINTYVLQMIDGFFQELFLYVDGKGEKIMESRICTKEIPDDLKHTYEKLFEEIEQHIIKQSL